MSGSHDYAVLMSGKPNSCLASTVNRVECLCAALNNAKNNAWEDVWSKHGLEAVVNDRGFRRFTLLHHACWWGKEDAISKLVAEFGADLAVKTLDGMNVFDVVEEGAAARGAEIATVHALLENLVREKGYNS